MSDEQTRPAIRSALQPPLSFGGLERSLQLTYELNEQFLLLLRDLSIGPKPTALRLVSDQKQLLAVLTPIAIRKTARLPFLLCDFAFTDASAWSLWTSGRSGSSKFSHPLGVIAANSAASVARSVLTAAWIICSQDVRHANLLFGMPAPISSAVACLRMSDLDRIAQTDASQLRPRWETRPSFWQRLLCATHSGDERQLQASRIHGLQMLAGEHSARQRIPQAESGMESNGPRPTGRLTDADFSLPTMPGRRGSRRPPPQFPNGAQS